MEHSHCCCRVPAAFRRNAIFCGPFEGHCVPGWEVRVFYRSLCSMCVSNDDQNSNYPCKKTDARAEIRIFMVKANNKRRKYATYLLMYERNERRYTIECDWRTRAGSFCWQSRAKCSINKTRNVALMIRIRIAKLSSACYRARKQPHITYGRVLIQEAILFEWVELWRVIMNFTLAENHSFCPAFLSALGLAEFLLPELSLFCQAFCWAVF